MKSVHRRLIYIAIIGIVVIFLLMYHQHDAKKERVASYNFNVLCENFPRIAHEDLETAKNLAKKIASDGLDPADSGSYYIRPPMQQDETYYTPLRFWRIHIDNLYLEKRPIIYDGKFYFYSNELIIIKNNSALFPINFGEEESVSTCKGSIYDIMGKMGKGE